MHEEVVRCRRAPSARIAPFLLLLEFHTAAVHVRCAQIATPPQCTIRVFNLSRREIAEVFINSDRSGMFNANSGHPFNLTPALRPGTNAVRVRFLQAPGPPSTGSLAGWSYGYAIAVDHELLKRGECGFADRLSCASATGTTRSFRAESGTARSTVLLYDSIFQLLYFSNSGKLPVIRQQRDSDWAALASMLISWRSDRVRSQSEVVGLAGSKYERLLAAGLSLNQRELDEFREKLRLRTGSIDHATPNDFIHALESRGPLWLTRSGRPTTSVPFVNEIVFGLAGDGSARGTYVSLIEPATGTQRSEQFSKLTAEGRITVITFISAK